MLRGLVLTGLVVYCLLVVAVLLWPNRVDAPVDDLLDKLIYRLQQREAFDWVTYNRIEFLANIALFFPIGLLGGMLLPRRAFLVPILLGACASTFFELVQQNLLADRVGSVLDVIANSAGTVLGVLVAMLPFLRKARRPRRDHPAYAHYR